jgi:outer membrane immunogenic protein
MKRTILGRLALAALLMAAPVGIASAADLAVKAPPKPLPPTYNWTGFYIGAYAGAAWTGPATTSDPCIVGSPVCGTAFGTYNGIAPTPYNFDASFTGGGEIGYNWQPTPFTLLGFENKFGYMNLKASIIANPFPAVGLGDTVYNTKIGNWYDAYTARVGAVDGHFMLFLEGGGVTARVSTGVVDTIVAPFCCTINTTTSKTVTGWAAGGGIEYAIDNSWSIKGEVLGLGLHSTINHCGVAASAAGPFATECSFTKIGGVTMVDIGLNYRFGVAPLLARY